MSTTSPSGTGSIESSLNEARTFPPGAAKALGFERWHVSSMDEYKKLHARSISDPEGFWGEQAKALDWFTCGKKFWSGSLLTPSGSSAPPSTPATTAWDRHVKSGHGDDVALIWEGEPILPITSHGIHTDHYERGPEITRLTYADLQTETSRLGKRPQEPGRHKKATSSQSTCP